MHGLDAMVPDVTVKGQTLERVKEFKLLGTWISDNLKWTNHVKYLVSSCYSVLSTLRKLKNLAPFHVKKQLAESLILSKLDYNDAVCYLLPAAGFVTNRYSSESDVLNLG